MAPIRSSIALVAGEIAKALRGLTPEAQHAALSLAASKVPDSPLGADAPVKARAATFLEEVRRLLENPPVPPGAAEKIRVVVKASDGCGSIAYIARYIDRRRIGHTANFYASSDGREVFRTLYRDVLKPLGLPPPPLPKRARGTLHP
jgi:hypothetical protein